NIGSLLQEFQITSAISGSSADTEFTLGWQGAPNQFALEQLTGQVAYRLGEGSLTEVSDQGARLFSIFSLDSLLRKLRLDFRDVFAKGFFYNGMSGNLAIAEGVVHTSNAAIDGVPGNLQIQGYADLVSRDMDYQMAFSPKVTSSLPIIIAWMVNPATGLAALALDEVFQSAEVISKINFTVTGSFDKPLVTEVNRHSKQVPVPVRVAQPEAIIEPPAVDPSANPEQQPHGD
ncbi:YhdP family protein, partial [Rheinheimera sp.]